MFGTVNMLIKDKSYEVRLNWRGLARSFDLNDTITTEYKPVGLTEPIATHPYFADFAGNWADRKKDISNPDFDKEGRFVKFHKYLPNGKRNPFAGIENFYQSGLIVADYRVVKDGESEEEDQYDVGKISVPDVEKLPVMFTEGVGIKRRPRNHLLISVELEDLKTGYIGVRREWQTSGPKGWDPDIYEYEDPEEE
jgi:hypothetical protein